MRLYTEGKKMPRWQFRYLQMVHGSLELELIRWPPLEREMPRLRLAPLAAEGLAQPVPDLFDPVLLRVSRERLHFVGVEMDDEISSRHVYQEWVVRFKAPGNE